MSDPVLRVLSLRYSSWSIRPWLALTQAEAAFSIETADLVDLGVDLGGTGEALLERSSERLARRRDQGSVTGLFPVLSMDGKVIHESLAICEWVADRYPEAGLWPANPIDRARARSICCEMVAGFQNLRQKLSCHAFARVPAFVCDATTRVEIQRIFEIWKNALNESGGPFLFGEFGIPDCMYFPVLTRFRTYGVELSSDLEAYAQRLEATPVVGRWRKVAAVSPPLPRYDEWIRQLGGDPDAMAGSFS